MMPMSAQSSLSHCTTTRPGMVAGSSGTTESSCPWQIDHAARVLAEMARQILHRQAELEEFAQARMREVEPGIAELALQRLVRIVVLPRAHQLREPVEHLGIEAQHLADLARRRAPAIGDDVGGHGRAALAVALVDVLDGALALLARRQVEIDVRPLAAFFGEKALEQQVHADWDRRR